jgi:hypothetical protein
VKVENGGNFFNWNPTAAKSRQGTAIPAQAELLKRSMAPADGGKIKIHTACYGTAGWLRATECAVGDL